MKFIMKNKRSVIIALSIVLMMYFAATLFFSDLGPAAAVSTVGENSGLTLVIDAGHGGEDGGAVTAEGVYESDINLAIALKLEQIAALYGMPVVMTRSTPEINYPSDAETVHEKKVADQYARLKLINSTQNAVLISIHQNKFTTSAPFGAQVLYAETKTSDEFGKKMQDLLINTLNPENYRTASEISDDIFLLKHISCPAVLVECGFLSNNLEQSLLQTDKYQLKIAITLAAAYMQSQDLLSTYYGGTYEG